MEDFFRSRDRDFDGYLSFEEFLGEESKLEKLFKKMDSNNDGKVSKQVNTKARTCLIDYLRSKNHHLLYIYNYFRSFNKSAPTSLLSR